MAARQDLHIRQGETWSYVFTKRDAAGAAVDLTGYTARAAVKDSYAGGLQAYLSSEADANGGTITLGGVLGTVTIAMTAAQSAALAGSLNTLAPELYGGRQADLTKPEVCLVYDLELVSGAGVVTRDLEGRVVVHREVTS